MPTNDLLSTPMATPASALSVLSINDDALVEMPTLSELLASSSNNSLPSSTFESPEISSYLNHLTNLPLAELEAEPASLSSSSAQLTNALTTLCYTSYPTFLSLHASTSTLSSSLSSLSSSLDSLLSALPAFESSTRTFAQETREIQKERRKASLVLEQHDKLYDVLSLPMLLDSCVRSHNYNDALLLSNHATSLSQKFPSNPLIQSVKSECDSRVQAMLGQLLNMLSEQAKLPALFRAVNFLRKMVVLDEQELALAFLTGRGVYLDGALKAIEIEKKGVEGDRDKDKELYARFLKRYVDAWREGVYDVVTQYTTIFLERASSTTEAPTANLHPLLTMFTTYHLQNLLTLLRDTLPLIPDPSMLTSLLTQLTYCANSFARVGIDFKPLLAPIFTNAVRHSVSLELEEAADAWCNTLAVPTSSGKDKSKTPIPKPPSQVLITTSALSAPPRPTVAQLENMANSPANVPPQMLVSYPPLAIYTNAILMVLNGLRMLAPVDLYADLLGIVEKSVARGGKALLQYAQQRPWRSERRSIDSMDGSDKESEVVTAAGVVYFDMFVPFVLRALSEGVYGVPLSGESMRHEELELVVKNWVAFTSI